MTTPEEKYAIQMLQYLRLEYEKATKPYVDLLVRAEACRVGPMVISIDEYKSINRLQNSSWHGIAK